MKELPDEQKMLEMLLLFKEAEEKAREMSELATDIALTYKKKSDKITQINPGQSLV